MRITSFPAIIYCRVSSQRQLTDGNGLEGQEKRCCDYASLKGYEVRKVFKEKAFTGDLLNRPAMKELLLYLEEQPEQTVVVIDDLKRFARNVETHFTLKQAVVSRGGVLDSPGFRFEATPENKFVETVIAGAAELERNQNRQQVLNRMKSRLELGYWPFRCPPGYRNEKHRLHKKLMTPDPIKAPIIREALEGFAEDRFHAPMDVQRFLTSKRFFGSERKRPITSELTRINTMLRELLYTGNLEYKPWNVGIRKAAHPSLISMDTYEKIQEKLAGRNPLVKRADASEEFVLRNFIECAACQRALTASWSTGRSARYPYYHCPNRYCGEYGKTIRRDLLEQDFERYLQRFGASDTLLELARGILIEVWEEQLGNIKQRIATRQARIDYLLGQVEMMAQKLVLLSNETAIKAVEGNIVKLERERFILLQKPVEVPLDAVDVGTAYDLVLPMLKNPCETWKHGGPEAKRLVTHLVFPNRLPYARSTGFGTGELSLPYQLLASPGVTYSNLVDYPVESWNQLIEIILQWHLLVEHLLVSAS